MKASYTMDSRDPRGPHGSGGSSGSCGLSGSHGSQSSQDARRRTLAPACAVGTVSRRLVHRPRFHPNHGSRPLPVKAQGPPAPRRRTHTIPATCAVLTMQAFRPPNSVLSDAAERTPRYRARIQSAIDKCTPGKAVTLHADVRNNIFLSGPLQLKPGVTVVVEANAAIFASRNPRDYDVAPGSCGIVGERGPGCKTLITADHAPERGGIMGDGLPSRRTRRRKTNQRQKCSPGGDLAKSRQSSRQEPGRAAVDRRSPVE